MRLLNLTKQFNVFHLVMTKQNHLFVLRGPQFVTVTFKCIFTSTTFALFFLHTPWYVTVASCSRFQLYKTSFCSVPLLSVLTLPRCLWHQFGLQAWRTARDVTGFTPEDYARSRGHESYLRLVRKKIDKQSNNSHVVLNMPASVSAPSTTYKQPDILKYVKSAGFEMEKGKSRLAQQQPYCNLCSQQLVHRPSIARSLLYRPAMLSMVGIAAVCVCVGLLFKGPPEVALVFPPFRWERLGYGSMWVQLLANVVVV